jgi:hypothetical protein
LLRWGKARFPEVPQQEVAVYVMLWDDRANTVCNAAPCFKLAQNKGVYNPAVDNVATSLLAMYCLDSPGGCAWVKEPATPANFGAVQLYRHKCVRVADNLLVDWGYDQFALPANLSIRLCEA